ncbi:MAG: carbohydrate kinase family protein [Deltaproteobacteria bacterium]|nr:carbohydrate kinase family protein [Deltaproteobacteria bacterium]
MEFDCIGFGSINIDEFWEAPSEFFKLIGISPSEEVVRDTEWFREYYPLLEQLGSLKAIGPGGSAANAVAALRRMGFKTGFYGAAGNDIEGKINLEELGRNDLLRVQFTELPSGRCLALINPEDSNRDRALVILPNANSLADSNSLNMNYFHQSDWVHLTSFVSPQPLEAQKQLLQDLSPSIKVSFDPGVVYCRLGIKALKPIIARSDVLFVTEEELKLLTSIHETEESISGLLTIGAKIIVLKMGPLGLKAFQADRSWFQETIPPAGIVDRTGAGDVAAAGFLAGMISSLTIANCLALAAWAASRSIEGYGRSTYPDNEFLKIFLAKNTTSVYS